MARPASLPLVILNAEPWVQDSLCSKPERGVPPDYWFPKSERGGTTVTRMTRRAAIGTCGFCPVRIECLTYALAHDIRYGIWGGKTTTERQNMTEVA